MSAVVAPAAAPSMGLLARRVLSHRKTTLRLFAMLLVGFIPILGQVATLGWMGRTARHLRKGHSGLPEVRIGHDIWSAGLIQIAAFTSNIVLAIPIALLTLPVRLLGWVSILVVMGLSAALTAIDPTASEWSVDIVRVVALGISKGVEIFVFIPVAAISFEAMRMGTMGEVMPVRRALSIGNGILGNRVLFITLILAVSAIPVAFVGTVVAASFHSLWALVALPAALLCTALFHAVAIARWDYVVGDGLDFK